MRGRGCVSISTRYKLLLLFIAVWLIYLFIAIVLLPGPRPPVQDNTIQGYVLASDSTPLPNAKVELASPKGEILEHTTTDKRGYFTVAAEYGKGKGNLEIRASSEGFIPSKKLLIRPQPTNLTLEESRRVILEDNLTEKQIETCYVTDADYNPLHWVIKVEPQNSSAVLEIPKKPVVFHILYPVEGFGEVIVDLDIPLWLKRSTIKDLLFLKLLKELKTLEAPNINITQNLSPADLLWTLENLTLQKAADDIDRYRKADITIVITKNGEPVNASISYTLKENDFLFGWFGGLNPSEIELAKGLGFNYALFHGFWHLTEPSNDSFNFTQIPPAPESLNYGYAGLIGESPPYLSRLSQEELLKEVESHINETLENVDADYWDCYALGMNQQADNTLYMTQNRTKEQNIEITQACIDTLNSRGIVPTVTGWNIDSSGLHYLDYDEPPFRYFRALKGRFEPGFDFMYFGAAHEISPNETGDLYLVNEEDRIHSIPMRTLHSISRLLDLYSSMGPLHIRYFNAPSNYNPNVSLGYWKEPWNPEVQAEWITDYYTLMYSKPYVGSLNYNAIIDEDWKKLKTGLLYNDLSPKPSYHALRTLLNSWKSFGRAHTNKISFRGFKGKYEIIAEYENRTIKAYPIVYSDKIINIDF